MRAGSASSPATRVHLELFANGRVVIVPAAVGVGGARMTLGRVRSGTLPRPRVDARSDRRRPVRAAERRSATSSGVWGTRLAPDRLLSFRGAVRVYVNGVRRRGDPRTLALHDRDEIVLEVGPYIPPHRAYRFPPH